MWLDYAEETVRYYDTRGLSTDLTQLLDTVDKNVEDPMVKAFVKMELKSKYLFNKWLNIGYIILDTWGTISICKYDFYR